MSDNFYQDNILERPDLQKAITQINLMKAGMSTAEKPKARPIPYNKDDKVTLIQGHKKIGTVINKYPDTGKVKVDWGGGESSNHHWKELKDPASKHTYFDVDEEIGKKLLSWRRKQKHGAIMKPGTFERIKQKAAAAGATDPEAVAGAAYWKTARAKFRERDIIEDRDIDWKYIGFGKLEGQIKRQGGARDPGAVAAAIGRKKYGKGKFQRAAAKDHKMKGVSHDMDDNIYDHHRRMAEEYEKDKNYKKASHHHRMAATAAIAFDAPKSVINKHRKAAADNFVKSKDKSVYEASGQPKIKRKKGYMLADFDDRPIKWNSQKQRPI